MRYPLTISADAQHDPSIPRVNDQVDGATRPRRLAFAGSGNPLTAQVNLCRAHDVGKPKADLQRKGET